MSQFGIFGDDLGEYGDAALDSGGNLSSVVSSTPPQNIGPSIATLLDHPFTQQQTTFQNAPKPSMFRAAVPWLLGGLAIAAVTAGIIYLDKNKATKNDTDPEDDDGGGEGDEDAPPAPNFRRLAPAKKTKPATKPKTGAGPPKRCPVGTEVQTLIMAKERFDQTTAVAWARKHKFSAGKVDVTGQSYRIRQHIPSRYKPGSFRTITLTTGVQSVIGSPKKK